MRAYNSDQSDLETAFFVLHGASIEGCFLDANGSPSATKVVVVVVVILFFFLLLLSDFPSPKDLLFF